MIGIIMLSAKDFIKAMDAIPITKAIASGILSKTDIIKNWNLQGLKTRHSGLKALFQGISRVFQGFSGIF
jgi:hypothetical protein